MALRCCKTCDRRCSWQRLLTASVLILTLPFSVVDVQARQTQRASKSESRTDDNTYAARGLPASMERASQAIRASTVTIRVDRAHPLPESGPSKAETTGKAAKSSDSPRAGADQSSSESDSRLKETTSKTKRRAAPRRTIAVFSGVLVKKGFVATPLFLPTSSDPKVRITLPNGRQCSGKPRILDEYSGLAIIKIDDLTVPCLKLCDEHEPRVGAWVVNGAAWGRKEALVSFGMISGIDYRLPSAEVEPPPMIVCDLRAAETSKGSGIVATDGKLVGIVMAVSRDQKWTYVVPSSHINRLLRSLQQHDNLPDSTDGEILVLKRQVPRVGVRIRSEWNEEEGVYRCIVQRLATNGPADQAGMQVGDVISDVNGVAVRNWYDFVRDFSNRQPGDQIRVRVVRDDESLNLNLVLGGGFAAAGDNVLKLSEYITPEIRLDRESKTRIPLRVRESSGDSQLARFSRQNLLDTATLKTSTTGRQSIDDLRQQLDVERQRNLGMQRKLESLETKIDRMLNAGRGDSTSDKSPK